MNKKILSIFALIMAISILGVSCAKDNSTTNPTTGGSTAPITLDQAKKIIGATSAITADSASFDLAAVKDNVKTSGANFTLEVSDDTGSLTVDYATFLEAVKGIKTAMDAAENNLITVEDTKIKLVVAKDGDTTAIATIPYALKSDNKKTGNFVITFTLTGTTSTFAYTEIAITAIKGIFNNLTVDVDGGTSTSKDNVKFASSVTIETGSKIAVSAADGDSGGSVSLGIIDAVVTAINGKTLEGTTISATAGTEPSTGGKNPAEITVTITLDNGYKFASDVASGNVSVASNVATITVEITPAQNWAARG